MWWPLINITMLFNPVYLLAQSVDIVVTNNLQESTVFVASPVTSRLTFDVLLYVQIEGHILSMMKRSSSMQSPCPLPHGLPLLPEFWIQSFRSPVFHLLGQPSNKPTFLPMWSWILVKFSHCWDKLSARSNLWVGGFSLTDSCHQSHGGWNYHVWNFPWSPNTEPPPWDQLFKHIALWRHFMFIL